MIQIGIASAVVLSLINLILLVLVLKRFASISKDKEKGSNPEELHALRQEVSRSEQEVRSEVRTSQKTITDMLLTSVSELSKTLTAQLDGTRNTINDRFQKLQQSNDGKLEQVDRTVTKQLQTTSDTLVKTVGELGKAQTDQLTNSTKAINDLTQSNKTSIDDVRTVVDQRLQDMQTSNESKLDEMRKTVDEQLHSTLEKRLGESFNIVSKRLEDVQRGLGEMQSLATGVGDLKQVLTNVKARGTWGEVQLGTLLEDILTPSQYSKNVKIHENSQEHVEYVIHLPGADDEPDSCVWLPIDSKLPLADYERVIAATDAAAEKKAVQALTRVVRAEAKKIQEKYIAPPKTTGFAIMFLPTEGLYAEVLRVPGLITEFLQRYQIVIAGPTTLAAILNSLRMGFRTLMIEKRSSEIWEILGAVKSEFGKFGGVMDKLKKQLNTAANTVDETGVRTRAMERKLRTVEELPVEEASVQIGLPDGLPVIQQNGGDD